VFFFSFFFSCPSRLPTSQGSRFAYPSSRSRRPCPSGCSNSTIDACHLRPRSSDPGLPRRPSGTADSTESSNFTPLSTTDPSTQLASNRSRQTPKRLACRAKILGFRSSSIAALGTDDVVFPPAQLAISRNSERVTKPGTVDPARFSPQLFPPKDQFVQRPRSRHRLSRCTSKHRQRRGSHPEGYSLVFFFFSRALTAREWGYSYGPCSSPTHQHRPRLPTSFCGWRRCPPPSPAEQHECHQRATG
jgi:hypothetical protein